MLLKPLVSGFIIDVYTKPLRVKLDKDLDEFW